MLISPFISRAAQGSRIFVLFCSSEVLTSFSILYKAKPHLLWRCIASSGRTPQELEKKTKVIIQCVNAAVEPK
jgi:hypothetical protein